jgi:hypothetical protein
MAGAGSTSKKCFVIGPIGKFGSDVRAHADWLLEGIIQPTMASFPDYLTERADKIADPGLIDAQVINALLEADLVIADLSMLNPNAFYEIGIRHMAQKPIIHMQRVSDEIPFDISLFRSIKFSIGHPNDLKSASAELKRAVEAIETPGYQVQNPVTSARGIVRLEEKATPELRIVLDHLAALGSRVSTLERHHPRSDYHAEDEFGPEGGRSKMRLNIAVDFDTGSDANDDKRREIMSVVRRYIETSAFGIAGDRILVGIPHGFASSRAAHDLQTELIMLPHVQSLGIEPF